MTFKYVNRKNLVFYLHHKKDENGNDEYFFSRAPQKNDITEIPEWYQLEEDTGSAKVSLKKIIWNN